MSGAIPAIGKRLPVREVRPAILGGLFGSRYAISIRTFGDLHCFLLRDRFTAYRNAYRRNVVLLTRRLPLPVSESFSFT